MTRSSEGRVPVPAYISSADHGQGILGGKTIESALSTDGFGNPVFTQKATFQCWDHGCDGRSFSSLSNYRRHCRERSTTTETVFHCPHCSQTFTRASGRNMHVERGRCHRMIWSLRDDSTIDIGDERFGLPQLGTDLDGQSYPSLGQEEQMPWLDISWSGSGYSSSW